MLSLLTVFFLYQVVGGAIAYMLGAGDISRDSGDINMIRLVLSFGQFMFILVPSVVLVLLRGDGIRDTFRLNPAPLRLMLLSVAGVILVQPLLQALVYFQNELIFSVPGGEFMKTVKELFDSLEETTLSLVKAASAWEFIIVLFVIAVTPAISEEFLFRGLVFRNFGKIARPSVAVFLAGLIFALFHFHPFNLIPLILLGVFLTFAVQVSDSIYPAIACHFLNNFISAAFVYIYGAESLSSPDLTNIEKLEFAGAGLASLIAFIIILKMMSRYSVRKEVNSDIKQS